MTQIDAPGSGAGATEGAVDAVVGQWVATYTSGDWILLSGPTSLVLLEPPGPERSSMVTVLWHEVVASSSMTDLAGRLAAYPLDTLPSFAAFFWTGGELRSLVRGAVSVVDLASGTTVAQGEGVQTWTEIGLGDVRQVLVEGRAGDGTRLELPLVVGAVHASSVRLDATEAGRVSSPQLAATGAAPAYADEEEVPAYADEEEARPAYAQEEAAPGDDRDTLGPGGEPDGDAVWTGLAALEPPAGPAASPGQPATLELAGPSTEPLDDPFADDPDPWPQPTPEPAWAFAEEGAEEGGDAEMENARTELMPPPSSGGAESSEVSQNSLIMAVVCQYGHASAQNATACRICGSPISPQGPQLMPRPVLAVLRSSDGTTAEVDRAVLVGRAPSGQRSSARAPKLMTVPSPGHDISRTHLEVAPEGWSVVVTDLHSTNGTILINPDGSGRQPLPAGEAVPVQLGSVVELGDGISVVIDFPQ